MKGRSIVGLAVIASFCAGCDPLDLSHPPKDYYGYLSVRSSELKKVCNGEIGWAEYEARYTMDALGEFDFVSNAEESNKKAMAEHRTNDIVKISKVVKVVAEVTGGACTNGILKIDNSVLIDKVNKEFSAFLERDESFSMRNWKEGTNCQFEISVKLKVPIARQDVLERSNIANLARLALLTNGEIVVSYNERARKRLENYGSSVLENLSKDKRWDFIAVAMCLLKFDSKERKQKGIFEEAFGEAVAEEVAQWFWVEGIYGNIWNVFFNPIADNICVSTDTDDKDGHFLTAGSIKAGDGKSLIFRIVSNKEEEAKNSVRR